jgi:hypothetical protein
LANRRKSFPPCRTQVDLHAGLRDVRFERFGRVRPRDDDGRHTSPAQAGSR